MFKNILISLDNSQYSQLSLEYGLWLAKRFDSTLYGQHVIDIVTLEGPFFHDLSGSLGFEPYLNFSAKMKEVLEERGKDILNDFAAKCEDKEVKYEIFLDKGIISNEICSRARVADLVLIAQKGLNAEFEKGLLGSITEAVTRKCSKPTMVTPGKFREIKNTLLCYDGSKHSNDVMQVSANFSELLGCNLTVLLVGKDEEGESALSDAKRYLASYAIKPVYRVLKGNPHEEIIKFSGLNNIDMIFMGAYGHSRIIEMVLGSTTEYVLRNADCPVIMRR